MSDLPVISVAFIALPPFLNHSSCSDSAARGAPQVIFLSSGGAWDHYGAGKSRQLGPRQIIWFLLWNCPPRARTREANRCASTARIWGIYLVTWSKRRENCGGLTWYLQISVGRDNGSTADSLLKDQWKQLKGLSSCEELPTPLFHPRSPTWGDPQCQKRPILGQLGGGLCFARRKVYAKSADPLLQINFETIERDERGWAAVKSLMYTRIPVALTHMGGSAM